MSAENTAPSFVCADLQDATTHYPVTGYNPHQNSFKQSSPDHISDCSRDSEPVLSEGHRQRHAASPPPGRSHRAWSVELDGRSGRRWFRGASEAGFAFRRHRRDGMSRGGAWRAPAGAGLLPASVVFTSAFWHRLGGAGDFGGRGTGVVAALDPRRLRPGSDVPGAGGWRAGRRGVWAGPW